MTPLRLDIRDRRLPGGRINISAETDKASIRDRRKAFLLDLLDAGEMDALALLRKRKLHIADVQRAFRAHTLPQLVGHASNGNGKGRPETVGAAVAVVLKRIEGNREAGTHTQYALYGAALIDGLGADTLVRSVTADQCDTLMKATRKRGTAWVASTRHHVRTFARRVWRAAGVQRDGNPWYEIELPIARPTRFVFLQPAEWRALFAYVEGTPFAAAVALGVLAGLRIGEVCNLRTDVDVDLGRRLIRIQPREGAYPWKPKTKNSTANVPISEPLFGILKAHVDAGFAGERYFLIVRAGIDRPIGVGTMQFFTRRAFEAVGIKYGQKNDGLTFHSLRHTFASWMAQNDVQILKMARLMRDTVETVSRVYAHLFSEDLEAAVELVGRIAEGEVA